MVRVSGQVSGSTAVGPSIAGGLVLVKVGSLVATWRACRVRPLGIGEFRAWLACHELRARRCAVGEGRAVTYSYAELARLLGVGEKRARASINRLVAAGLLEWSEGAIGFPDPRVEQLDLEDSIGRGRGSVAIPRRMLRLLAGGARPALIVTAFGILLRCLSRRRGGFDGRGRVKASWVARAFAVDVRRVKQARLDLVTLGWIAPEPSDQRAMNRWGRAYRIDLAWDRAGAGGRSLPPPPTVERPATATPSSDLEPLPEGERNQEPADRGATGVELKEMGEGSKPLPAPTLDDVRPEDLRDTGRLLELHAQAVARGVVTDSEADQLHVVAAAEHALAVGKVNPAGLFCHLIRGRLWRYITQADEDRASVRLKARRRGPSPGPAVPVVAVSMGPGAAPSPDAPRAGDVEVIREIRLALVRAGRCRDDPFPELARRWGWTRPRYDRALASAIGAGGLSPRLSAREAVAGMGPEPGRADDTQQARRDRRQGRDAPPGPTMAGADQSPGGPATAGEAGVRTPRPGS